MFFSGVRLNTGLNFDVNKKPLWEVTCYLISSAHFSQYNFVQAASMWKQTSIASSWRQSFYGFILLDVFVFSVRKRNKNIPYMKQSLSKAWARGSQPLTARGKKNILQKCTIWVCGNVTQIQIFIKTTWERFAQLVSFYS